MSLRGRYVIDRIKNVVSKHFRLPCPPYGEPDYWDKAYTSCEFLESEHYFSHDVVDGTGGMR